MPLAVPLLIPFATAVGLPIAGLGAIEIGKKVKDFIEDNPKISGEILTSLKESLLMTTPAGAGLNTLFNKEAGITLEDLDEMTDEEAADLSKEDKAEIMKEVGKSKGGDKRQRMIEISEKLGLSGEGKEKQTIVDEVEERYDEGGVEDAPKPKFDYKKFFRNRRADGGAIGIEVLFEEKKDGGRIGFANGGENIIGADLKDPETEFGLRPNTDDRMPLALAVMPEKVRNVFDVASDYNAAKGLTGDTSGGYLSNLRHGTAASQMRDALGGGVTGIIGANVLGLAQELPGLSLGAVNEVRELFGGPKHSFMNTLNQTGEDIYANLYGSLYGKEGTTAETYADLANKFATDTGIINTALNATANKQNALNQLDLYQAISNYGTAAAADFRDGEMLQTPGVMVDANDGFRTSPRTNVQGRDLEADLGTRINPDIQPSLNMFQRAGNTIQSGLGSIKDFMPFIGNKSLTGMAMQGLGRVGEGIGNFFRGNPEQRARNEYNSQFSTGDTYGYGMGAGNLSNKDAFGYNTVSGFGNYEQHMKDKVEELEDLLEKTGRKGFKPGTYQFNMLKDYTKNINKIQEDDRIRQEEAQKALERELAKYAAQNRIYGSGGGRDESLNTGPGGSYSGRGDQGATTANFSGDFATDSASYDMKDGGPVGLASMFVEKR